MLRAVVQNNYKSLLLLLRDKDTPISNNRISAKSIHFANFNLARLGELLNNDESNLNSLKFRTLNSSRFYGFNQSFLSKSINFSNLRICPECFLENQTVDFVNNVAARTFCTKHERLLISENPNTGRKLTWGNNYLLKSAEIWGREIPTTFVSDDEFKLNQMLELLRSGKQVCCGYNINLAEYCDLLQFFSHFDAVAYGAAFGRFQKTDLLHCQKFYLRGYRYIQKWPNAFYEMLSYFERNPMSQKRVSGIRKCYRDLYDDIYSTENEESTAYLLLRKGFEEYLRKYFTNGAISTAIKSTQRNIVQNSKLIERSQAAKILNCHSVRFSIYIQEGMIDYEKQLENGKTLFNRQSVIQLSQRLSNCYSLAQTSEILCISQFLLRQLLKNGLINALIKSSDKRRDWLIERCEIIRLIKALMLKANQSKQESMSNKVRFGFAGINTSELLHKMLKGSVVNLHRYGASRLAA